MKKIFVEVEPTTQQDQVLTQVEQLLDQVGLELVGTRPKDR